ncbi:MAG: hypothetical protein JO212_08970 [Acetobacteraceae bacterium]|nr:hypothetical protein [Acetobacteraceae bacterium]MBV8590176.1 hypothetical protein [Acetobacteraceae bacterium]
MRFGSQCRARRGRDRHPRVRVYVDWGLRFIRVYARARVEVLAQPGPYRPWTDQRRRRRLLSEHAQRSDDSAPGGSTRAGGYDRLWTTGPYLRRVAADTTPYAIS